VMFLECTVAVMPALSFPRKSHIVFGMYITVLYCTVLYCKYCRCCKYSKYCYICNAVPWLSVECWRTGGVKGRH
jgi:hypothetical protein